MSTIIVIKKVVHLTQCGHVIMPTNSQQMAAAVLRRIALPSDRCRQFTSCIDPPTPVRNPYIVRLLITTTPNILWFLSPNNRSKSPITNWPIQNHQCGYIS